MGETLKISGIYNSEILNRTSLEGVNHFAFDFRVRSPNFLPEYSFKEIIEKNFNHQAKYYLHYQDEKDFMINRLIDELKKSLHSIGRGQEYLKNFILQFSDAREVSFYENCALNFIWEYHPLGDIERIVQCKNNCGILIPYDYIQNAANDGSLQNMAIKILRARQLKGKSGKDKEPFQVTLQLDWSSDVLPSLSEFLSFDIIDLPINSNIESSYRNVDYTNMINSLADIKKIAFQNI
ncbi:MAG: hypothetical protein HN576_12030 [Bacteriovoracaceae bacterium]|jgi:hypothetical protein|nr:hypothetical protein [Bacteriovoracaceae bacterium]